MYAAKLMYTVKKKYRKIRASNLPTNYCKIYRKSIVKSFKLKLFTVYHCQINSIL